MKAEVRWANIWFRGAVVEPEKFDQEDGWKIRSIDTVGYYHAQAQVLVYPQALLDRDGYVVVTFLGQLEKTTRALSGVYGPPKDFGSLRGHLICRIMDAQKTGLELFDWGVDSWQMEKTKETTK